MPDSVTHICFLYTCVNVYIHMRQSGNGEINVRFQHFGYTCLLLSCMSPSLRAKVRQAKAKMAKSFRKIYIMYVLRRCYDLMVRPQTMMTLWENQTEFYAFHLLCTLQFRGSYQFSHIKQTFALKSIYFVYYPTENVLATFLENSVPHNGKRKP